MKQNKGNSGLGKNKRKKKKLTVQVGKWKQNA